MIVSWSDKLLNLSSCSLGGDRKMNVGGRNRRGAILAVSVLLAAPIASATSADAQTPSIEAAVDGFPGPFVAGVETPPAFGTVAGGPLLDTFNAPKASPSPDVGPFARLAAHDVASLASAGSAEAGAVERSNAAAVENRIPDPFPTRSASPAPARAPTAIAAAADRLILGNSANPLGAGDWRAARAAIGAFYAARDFEPVWVGRNGPDQRGALGAGATRARGRRRPRNPGFVPAEARRRPDAGRTRQSRDGDRRRGRRLRRTGERIADRASAHLALDRRRSERRRSWRRARRNRRRG